MIFKATELAPATIIEPERRADERGFLARTFCERELAEHGVAMRIVQASTIFSPRAHTLRGLHFQTAPHAEIKLVRCTRGAAFVVIVDLRERSPTRRRWLGVELTPENGRQLLVPESFAQGYQTLADDTEVAYAMSHEYVAAAASGVRWDDPAFGIDWPAPKRRIMSERDEAWPDYAA